MQYYLIIDTDNDFGLISDTGFRIHNIAKIKAQSKKKLKEFVDSLSVFEINKAKTEIGEAFLNTLKKDMDKKDAGRIGGNWHYEFGTLQGEEWDLYL